MKKLISLVLCLAMVLSILPAGALTVYAADVVDSGECGAEGSNVTWTLYSDGLLEITGTGAMADHACSSMEDVINVTISDGITSLGDHAFQSCRNLTKVTLGKDVSRIGIHPFDLTNLTTIIVSGGNTAFTSENGVLYNKNKTTLVLAPQTLSGEFSIPDTVTKIGDYSFSRCEKLTGVIIPKGVTSIGEKAFSFCKSLKTIDIPDSVTSLGESAFQLCYGLTDVELGDGLVSIGNGAFSNCEQIRAIAIPDSVTTIGDHAFTQCFAMASLTLGKRVAYIGTEAFYRCESLTELTIPDSVTSFGMYSFYECSSVTKLTLGSGKGNINIGWGTFTHLDSLKEVTITESVKTLDRYAFSHCINLENVTVADTVTSIGEQAFVGCGNLKTAKFLGDAPEIGTDVFLYCHKDFSIYYPEGGRGWTSPEWKGYAAYPFKEGDVPEEWPVLKNAHCIVVADGSGKNQMDLSPVSNAQVEVVRRNGDWKGYYTDENGQVFIEETGVYTILISADGYNQYTARYDLKGGSSRVHFLEKTPSVTEPYFTMIAAEIDRNGDTVDLRSHAVHYEEGSKDKIKIWLSAFSNGYGSDKVVFLQKATDTKKGVEVTFEFDSTQLPDTPFVFAPGSVFTADRPVYAQLVYRAWDEDGAEKRTEPVEINLFIDPATDFGADSDSSLNRDEEEYDGSLDVIGDHKVETDNEIVNKILNADFSISSELIPLHIMKVPNQSDGSVTYRVVVGLQNGESSMKLYSDGKKKVESYKEENTWNDFVSMFNTYKEKGSIDNYVKSVVKKYKDSMKSNKIRAVVDLEADVAGYFTATFDKNGKEIKDKTSGGFALQMGVQRKSGKTFFIQGIPVYYEMIVGADMDLDVDLSVSELMELVFVLGKIDTKLPYVHVGGGVGVRGVAQLGAYGGLNHRVKFHSSAEKLSIGGQLTSTVYFKVKILNVIEEKIGEKGTELTLVTWGDYDGSKAAANAAAQAKLLYGSGSEEEEGFQLVEREYLDYEGQWNSVPFTLLTDDPLSTLQYGTMPDAMPRIHTIGDKQILLFTQDVANRAVGNHTRLVYSVFENGVWSEPAPVWESDSADFFFKSVVENDRLYVTWQKSSGVVEGTDPEGLLAAVTENSEICLAVWDNETNTFTQQQYLTNDSTLDMMPSVAADGSTATVVWVSNDKNDALGSGGNYTIHQVVVTDGVAGSVEELYTTTDFIAEIAAGNDGHVFFTTVNEDALTNVYRIVNRTAVPVMEKGNYAGLTYENGYFLWQENGVLYRYSTDLQMYDAMVAPANRGVSSSFQYVSNGETEAVVWAEANDSYSIMASIFADGTWQEPVVLVEDIRETVTCLDAAMTEDGKYAVAVNTAVLGEDGYESTALEYALVQPRSEVVLNYAYVDYPNAETASQEIRINLENTGSAAVEQVKITVSSGSGVYLSKYYDVNLQPGGIFDITDTLNIANITELTEADVVVSSEYDTDPGNNSAQVTLGHTDLFLSLDSFQQGDNVMFLLTASNGSRIDATATLRITADSMDGTEVAVQELGVINREENIQYVFILNKNEIDFGGNSTKHYFFTLECPEADWSDSDNMCFFSVSRPLEVEEDPEGETVEIDLIQPESVSIQPGSLSFADPDSESVQLTAQIIPANASITDVQWEADDSSIVYITSDGIVTPLAPGTTTITATLGYELTDTITVTVGVPAHIHTVSIDPGVSATCTETGMTDGTHCSTCGTVLIAQGESPALGHRYGNYVSNGDATCTADGEKRRDCVACDHYEIEVIKATGHKYEDGKCTVCGAEDMGYTPPTTDPEPEEESVIRLAGADRFDTAFKAANELKAIQGVEKFDSIVVASGAEFADALAGSYLAAVKEAPILLSYKAKQNEQVQAYIKENLAPGGTVYILGGTSAVPSSMESGLSGLKIKRLAGADRFETNLLILKEAGVEAGDEILVCTGKEFADSLSASATGKPILLVYKKLTDGQKAYLSSLKGNKFCIVGGESAVPTALETAIKAYGTTTRLAGKDRLVTSVMVAQKYFSNPDSAVVAYGWNYPDGLCGGPLAYAMDAPLILTYSKPSLYATAVNYTNPLGIKSGYILGGTGLVYDEAVRAIFSMAAADVITLK